MSADAHTPDLSPLVDAPHPEAAPGPPDPGAISPDPHDALGLLGELEQRLGQLKQWQADNDQEAQSVREQALRVAEQEQAFATEREQLGSARRELDTEREAITAERRDLATARSEIDNLRRQLDEQRISQEDRTGELDQARAELEQRDGELTHRTEMAEARNAELQERSAALDAQQARLDEQTGQLADWQQQLEARSAALDEQETKLDAARQKIDSLREEVDQRSHELTDGHAALDQDRTELHDQRKQVSRTQMELKLRSEALDAQQSSLDKARTELAELASQGDGENATEALDELRAQRAQIDADRAELDAMLASLESREAELVQREGGLDQAAAQAARLAGDSGDSGDPGDPEDAEATGAPLAIHADVVDDGISPNDTAGMLLLGAELQQREAELNKKEHTFRETLRLSKDKVLAERKLVHDRAAELEELSHHLADREVELLEARGQIDAERSRLDDEQARLAAEREEIERLRADFDRGSDVADTVVGYQATAYAMDELDKAEAKALVNFDALAAEIAAREAAFEEKKQSYRKKIERTRAELIEQRDALRQRSVELDARASTLDEREAELNKRQAELDRVSAEWADRPSVEGLGEAATAEREAELRDRAAELEQQAAQLAEREALVAAGDPDGEVQRRKINALEAELAESRKAGHQLAGLEKERRMLVEVKKFLETSEGAMVQRWATKTTATIVAVGIVALACAAAFSFAVGRQLASPLWETSLALSVAPARMPDASNGPRLTAESEPAAADPLTELKGDAWLQAFGETVLSEPVMMQTLNVMDKDGLRLFTSPQALAQHYRENLKIAGEPARVELHYQSTDAEHAVGTLDALGKAILSYQMTVDRKAGRPDTARVLQKAQRHPEPVRDQSLLYTAIVFASVAGLALLATLVLRLSLSRSRRVLDPDDAPLLQTLDKPMTWSPVRGEA